MRHVRSGSVVVASAVVLAALAASPRPATGGGALTPAARSAAVKCQGDITKGGIRFIGKKLKLLDRCADAAFTCVHQRPGDPTCLDKATGRCTKALESIAGEEEKLAARVLASCDGLDPQDVLDALGLGYDALAAECGADFGTTLTDTAAIAACLVRQHECLAERLFQTHEPRAAEFLDLLGIDPGVDTCLEDFGGTGEPVGDEALAKSLDRCEGAIRKASTGFVVRKLKNVTACVRALFACAELDDGDARCVANARSKCDKAFGKTEQAVLKLASGVARRCRDLPVSAITEARGLGADALLDVCAELGVFGIGAVTDYGNCVVRQHECEVDALLRFEAPRAGELLAGVDRTLPGEFFCPTPVPTASATPVPTASATPVPTATP
jgi:hypothetical protein